MNSDLFKLNVKDLARGAANAVVGAVILAIAAFFQQEDFSIFSADWGAIGASALDAAITVFIAYIGTSLFKDKDGTIHFGRVKIKG